MTTKRYNVVVDCKTCADKIERKINEMPEIESCEINFLRQKMTVTTKDAYQKPIVLRAEKVGKRVDKDFEVHF
jgi:copper chaperone CopZ